MDVHFEERFARAALGWLCEPGEQRLRYLLARHSPVEVLDLLRRDGVPYTARTEIRHLPARRRWDEALLALEDAERAGGRILIPADPAWPGGLRDLGDGEPVCLWARGPIAQFQLHASVTVVGARACTGYGTAVTARLADGLAEQYHTVVSSAASGIDGTALRATLTGGGAAVAVLPCGLDQRYPAPNRPLLDRLAGEGLLLSAWPPGARPGPRRNDANRVLLAALTAGTVVIEALIRSHALRVVGHAVALGRAGMAVPGPVTAVTSAGCHRLLRTDPRVRLVTSAEQVVAELRDTADGGEGRACNT
ncbi:DNA-processing protein DprA [Dactylosporangium sp. NPDC051541]|uniref:DNA-processing protein DprA n=1 Tax=Dactylosporangium sp. NPDC051541 TaxID=3363977 RepID=UPI003794357A